MERRHSPVPTGRITRTVSIAFARSKTTTKSPQKNMKTQIAKILIILAALMAEGITAQAQFTHTTTTKRPI
jgi:hypothetical protein